MMTLIPGQIQAAQVDRAPVAGGFHPISVKDGFVMICIVSEKNLRELSDAMERPGILEDERFGRSQRFKHTSEFIAEIESWSSQLSAAECESRLNQFGVPCSVYNRPHDLFDHPQMLAREAFTELEDAKGVYWIQNAPFKFAGIDTSTSTEVPLLGEHTDEILAEILHYEQKDVVLLRGKGIVS